MPTYGTRRDEYQMWASRAAYLAGAAVGLIALTASELGTHLFEAGPKPLAAAAITLTVIAGALAGTARVQFQWNAALVQRRIDEKQVEECAVIDDSSFPRAASWFFALAFACIVGAGVCFLVLVWFRAT